MDKIIKANNEMLRQALENIKPIKMQLEKELLENYSDEIFNKLEVLNKEVTKAEKILDCTTKDGAKLYAELHPDKVDEKGQINSQGIKRLGHLEKKFGFIRFFKK
jgi:hypothetical protein